MTGTEYENLVVRLLRSAGWNDAQRVGGRGDLGADVIAHDREGTRLVVQCKRWDRTKIRSKEMQQFLGTVFFVHKADVALYCTTSTYTADARALGEGAGVRLLDGEAFARWQAGHTPGWLDRRPERRPPSGGDVRVRHR